MSPRVIGARSGLPSLYHVSGMLQPAAIRIILLAYSHSNVQVIILSVLYIPFAEMKTEHVSHLADQSGNGLTQVEQPWSRFVRFIAEDGRELCGEPIDENLDGN